MLFEEANKLLRVFKNWIIKYKLKFTYMRLFLYVLKTEKERTVFVCVGACMSKNCCINKSTDNLGLRFM